MWLIDVLSARLEVATYPAPALRYALKHNYPDLMDKAAPLTLTMPYETIRDFHPNGRLAWVSPVVCPSPWKLMTRQFEYRERYLRRAQSIRIQPPFMPHKKNRQHDSNIWDHYYNTVINTLGIGISTLEEMEQVIDKNVSLLQGCESCLTRSGIWKISLEPAPWELSAFSSIYAAL